MTYARTLYINLSLPLIELIRASVSLPSGSYCTTPSLISSAPTTTMRAAVALYEDPVPTSGADVWAAGPSTTSTATRCLVLAVSVAAASTLGFAAYHLGGLGAGKPLSALM